MLTDDRNCKVFKIREETLTNVLFLMTLSKKGHYRRMECTLTTNQFGVVLNVIAEYYPCFLLC